MRGKTGMTVLLLLLAAFWAAGQQAASKSGPPANTVSDEQVRAAQADLQHMRTLVQQMQMNLVSLPPGPTPLRHQFELEIEAWQALLDHMERQLPTTRPPGQSKP